MLLSPLKPQLLTLGSAPSLSLQFHTSSSLQEVATTTVTYCTNPFSIALAGTVTSTEDLGLLLPPTHPRLPSLTSAETSASHKGSVLILKFGLLMPHSRTSCKPCKCSTNQASSPAPCVSLEDAHHWTGGKLHDPGCPPLQIPFQQYQTLILGRRPIWSQPYKSFF